MKTKECIFCGGKRLTKEHVWPKWLRPYIVRDQKNHYSYSHLVHEQHSEESRKLWGCDPRDRTVRIVCQPCNGGWMSQLQSKAKPLVLPLIKGEEIELNTQDQRTLAFWSAMCAMTAEFLGTEERTAISSVDRVLLMKDTLLLSKWKIWLGHYRRVDWVGQWVHNMMPISSEDRVHPLENGIPQANTQTTTLVFGNLYVHLFSCDYPEIVDKVDLGERGTRLLTQIWPIVRRSVAWPREAMTDSDADYFAGAICGKLDRIGRDANPDRFSGPSPFPAVL